MATLYRAEIYLEIFMREIVYDPLLRALCDEVITTFSPTAQCPFPAIAHFMLVFREHEDFRAWHRGKQSVGD